MGIGTGTTAMAPGPQIAKICISWMTISMHWGKEGKTPLKAHNISDMDSPEWWGQPRSFFFHYIKDALFKKYRNIHKKGPITTLGQFGGEFLGGGAGVHKKGLLCAIQPPKIICYCATPPCCCWVELTVLLTQDIDELGCWGCFSLLNQKASLVLSDKRCNIFISFYRLRTGIFVFCAASWDTLPFRNNPVFDVYWNQGHASIISNTVRNFFTVQSTIEIKPP